MAQRTVKRAVEALYWLHNNAHHEAGWEEGGKHFFYRNYHDKLRVPAALMPEVSKYVRPNKRAFDTRMFALTRAGRLLVTR